MSSILTVRDAWKTLVFDSPDIRRLTVNSFPYDFTTETVGEESRLLEDGIVNFFSYLVSRTSRIIGLRLKEFQFPVTIKYYLEDSPYGEAFEAVGSALDLVHDIISESPTWGGTVDRYETRDAPVLSLINVGERPTWTGSFLFTGYIISP